MTPDVLTQAQADIINRSYPSLGAKIAAGTPLTQLASSYPQIYQGGAYNASTEDPVRDLLISKGYLDWGSDAAGNQGLTPGSALTEAMNAVGAGIKKGSNVEVGPSAAPFGVAPWSPGISGGGPDLKQISSILSRALSTGEMASNQWNKAPAQAGDIDPVTGMAKYDFTGVTPDIKMNSKWTAMQGPLITSLIMAPFADQMAAVLSAGLGSFGSAAFSGAGNAIMGGKVNPLSFLGPVLQQFNVPDWIAKGGTTLAQILADRGKVNPSEGVTLARILAHAGGGTNG